MFVVVLTHEQATNEQWELMFVVVLTLLARSHA